MSRLRWSFDCGGTGSPAGNSCFHTISTQSVVYITRCTIRGKTSAMTLAFLWRSLLESIAKLDKLSFQQSSLSSGLYSVSEFKWSTNEGSSGERGASSSTTFIERSSSVIELESSVDEIIADVIRERHTVLEDTARHHIHWHSPHCDRMIRFHPDRQCFRHCFPKASVPAKEWIIV